MNFMTPKALSRKDKLIEKYSWVPMMFLVMFASYLFIKVNFN